MKIKIRTIAMPVFLSFLVISFFFQLHSYYQQIILSYPFHDHVFHCTTFDKIPTKLNQMKEMEDSHGN